MTVIYEQRSSGTLGTTWRVELLDAPDKLPGLVRFYKANGQRKLLDQTACWKPTLRGWDRSRWFPKAPWVPKWLIQKVEAHMLQEAA